MAKNNLPCGTELKRIPLQGYGENAELILRVGRYNPLLFEIELPSLANGICQIPRELFSGLITYDEAGLRKK